MCRDSSGRRSIIGLPLLLAFLLLAFLALSSEAQAYNQYTPQCVLRAYLPTRAGSGSVNYYVSGKNDCAFNGPTYQQELEIEVCSQVHNANGNWYLISGSCVSGDGMTASKCYGCDTLYRQIYEYGDNGHEYRSWTWGWDKDANGNINDAYYTSSGWTD